MFTYKGLKAKLDRHIVTDEEVDRNLQRLLQQNPRIVEIEDRPTENGDEVVLNYAGFCDGVQFPGGTAENQTLVLGSGMFIPGFEEQLLDKVPGEEVTVKVTFPEQYHSEDLAGKEAEFRCKILKIRVKTPYDLDDTFAKEVGHCDTLEEMRTKLKESLQSYSDERGEMDLQDQLLNEAAKTLELQISEKMLADAVEDQLNLGQHIEGSFCRPEAIGVEPQIRIQNTHQGHIRKIQSLGDHLGANQHRDALRLKMFQYLLVGVGSGNGIRIHPVDLHIGEQSDQLLLHLLCSCANTLHRTGTTGTAVGNRL